MALVITLILLGLISILLVAFLTQANVEVSSAHSHAGGIQAEFFAQAGIDTAVAQLQTASGDTKSASTIGWISQPGQITTIYSNGAPLTPPFTYSLFSGAVSAATKSTNVDLNPPLIENTNQNLIANVPQGGLMPMYVQWLYVLQDGAISQVPLPAGNPVVGRFAYWVDDESSKINVNTASSRALNSNNLEYYSSPSRVDMRVLGTNSAQAGALLADINQVAAYPTNGAGHYYNSIEEVGQADLAFYQAATNNSFAVTTYNHSPELNMFGEQRIMLTTSAALANANGSTNFIDILSSPGLDPGSEANLDSTKMYACLKKIANELERTDWPIMPGQSFMRKFWPGKYASVPNAATYPNSPDHLPENRVYQIALNIIDYVRCAESTSQVVDPVFIYASYTNAPPNIPAYPSSLGGNIGASRRPCIVEMGLWVDNSAAVVTGSTYPVYQTAGAVRLYLPTYSGVTKPIDLSQFVLVTTLQGNYVTTTPLSGSMNAGDYFTVNVPTHWLYQYNTAVPATTNTGVVRTPPPVNIGLKVGLYNAASHTNVYDVVNIDSVLVAPTGAANTTNNIPSLVVNDPWVNKFANGNFNGNLNPSNPDGSTPAGWGDWYPATNSGSANNYFGTMTTPSALIFPKDKMGGSTYTIGSPNSGFPSRQVPPDMQANGITSAGIQLPKPAAPGGPGFITTTTGPGFVASVGELGHIHTGMSSYHDGNADNAWGYPWRTIHLQPDSTATDSAGANPTLPDWAILDLFSAPTIGVDGRPLHPYLLANSGQTNGGVTSYFPGGKINLNGAQDQPMATGNAGMTNYSRLLPLEALFMGADTNSTDPSLNGNPKAALRNTNSYAQACAIATNIGQGILATGGRAFPTGNSNIFYTPAQVAEIKGVSDGGELTEQTIREIAGLGTVRSGVYTVYSVGQTIQQDSAKNFHVLGERRFRTIVERVYAPSGAITFRTVSSIQLQR